MNSTKILGTAANKVKLSWPEYIFTHLIPTWFQSFNINFRIWLDLMTNNVSDYALLKDDDPLEECKEWFWSNISTDDVYPKEFLEYLLQMSEDVKTGKIETYSLDNIIDDLKLLSVDDPETGTKQTE
jgi:hypothetical protein